MTLLFVAAQDSSAVFASAHIWRNMCLPALTRPEYHQTALVPNQSHTYKYTYNLSDDRTHPESITFSQTDPDPLLIDYDSLALVDEMDTIELHSSVTPCILLRPELLHNLPQETLVLVDVSRGRFIHKNASNGLDYLLELFNYLQVVYTAPIRTDTCLHPF